MAEDIELKRLLDAMGDQVRLQMMYLLKHCGQMNVNQITGHFRISRPAISHHLKVLKDARVLQCEKKGQEVFYWLDNKYVANALRNLADKIESFIPDQVHLD